MTTKELLPKIYIGACTKGRFNVVINYHGNDYHCASHNTTAYDRIKGKDDIISDTQIVYGYTLKQALLALWDECKRKNELK